MSRLKEIREQKNLTQEELSEQSKVSVRTIQRIEAGTDPKGHTLRILAKTLEITETELLPENLNEETIATDNEVVSSKYESFNYSSIKLINLSSILFILLPPLNILVPLFLSFKMKQRNILTRQIISVQILWTIVAPIIFFLGIFLKLGREFTLIIIITIVLSNIFIILRNTAEIDRKKNLYIKLNFNIL